MTDFDDQRRLGIGSTDSAAILGVSPWKDAHDVWRQKVHGEPSKDPSLPMWLGTELEGAIGKLYTAETQIEVVRNPIQYKLEPRGILRCHVDFTRQHPVLGVGDGLVEAKTARSKRGWGEVGTVKIPRHYWIQVQHQMAVTSAPFVDVAVLFGHEDFRIYHIEQDTDFIRALIQDMEEWWDLYVVTETPPPVDGTEGSARWLRETYPRSLVDAIPATADHAALVRELSTLREAKDALARADEIMVQQLKDIIGDHEGMTGGNFTIRWKSQRDYQKVEWERVASVYREILEAKGIAGESLDSVVTQNTEIKEGKRPFILESSGGR